MATDSHKYANHVGREARHSAFEEFSRDERRPAVLLLSALVIAALFFAMGLMVGRWTAEPDGQAGPAPSGVTSQPGPAQQATPGAQPPTGSSTNPSAAASPDPARRFTLLVNTYDTAEKAQPLVKALQQAGFTDVRTAAAPAGGATPSKYSVLAGRFTEDEAREASRRMRAMNDPRVKNVRVIEEAR